MEQAMGRGRKTSLELLLLGTAQSRTVQRAAGRRAELPPPPAQPRGWGMDGGWMEPAWSDGGVGGAGSERGALLPITQAGIFKAALGTPTLGSHSFLLGIPNPPGCFENPRLTRRAVGRSQPCPPSLSR